MPSIALLLLLTPAAFAQDEAVDYGDINSWLCHPDNAFDLCDQDLLATVIYPDYRALGSPPQRADRLFLRVPDHFPGHFLI